MVFLGGSVPQGCRAAKLRKILKTTKLRVKKAALGLTWTPYAFSQ
jgi:hypothetical protein